MAASDRALEYRNLQDRRSWANPWERPWIRRSVKMQTWKNEPLREQRSLYGSFERVSSSNRKVWWYREPEPVRDSSDRERYFEMPFLTQHYFQTYLHLFAEACVSNFVRKHNCTLVRETDTMELNQWTARLKRIRLPNNEYSAMRKEIMAAIRLLRDRAIHREQLEIDALLLSIRLPELLDDWHRAFEVQ